MRLVNVAVNKVTSINRRDSVRDYTKWGDKDYLVDGLRTATGSSSGCSGCFASTVLQDTGRLISDRNTLFLI